MADFLGDLFGAITGQQTAPQQTIIDTNDLLNQTYSTLSSQVPNVSAYNNKLQPVLTGLQLQNQNQIFGPAANSLQQDTYQSILDQLHLGSALPQDLQDQVIQQALAGSSASGFGVSPGGRGLVARDLGLTGLDLLNNRQATALGAVNQLPVSHYMAQPQGIMDPGAISADIRGVQAAKDEFANLTEDIRRQNFSALINTGGRILGSVVGGIYGGPMGAQMGGQIGGSLITGSRVAGQQKQSSGGGGGGGFLSSLMGGGGGGAENVSGGSYGGATSAGPDSFGGGWAGGMMYT